jgi:hypothetical protein
LSSKKIAIGLFDQTLLSVMLVVSENVITTSGDLISENILVVVLILFAGSPPLFIVNVMLVKR